jgi:hypothetical protein
MGGGSTEGKEKPPVEQFGQSIAPWPRAEPADMG